MLSFSRETAYHVRFVLLPVLILVLVHTRMKTMHGSLPNKTNTLRFSCDVRFQPASHPVDPRYTASGADNPSMWRAGLGPSQADDDGTRVGYDLGFVSESVRRSMAAAKAEWSLVREPIGDFELSPAAQRDVDAARSTDAKL